MTLADDVTLDELIMAKDDLSGADIKVKSLITNDFSPTVNLLSFYVMQYFASLSIEDFPTNASCLTSH